MHKLPNPFNATLGSTPPYLAGREIQIADFEQALFDGPGAHERVSLVSGPRGVGKTVLLNAFEDVARERSWWVISETATSGFIQRMTDTVVKLTHKHFSENKKVLTGVSLASLGGVQFAEVEKYQPEVTLRDALAKLLTVQRAIDEQLEQSPVGILITLDELHYMRKSEIIDFGVTVQHLVRENFEIAVAMAGIPQAVTPLLASESGNPVTFLRRANRIDLGLIDIDGVRVALAEPVEDLGLDWEPRALEQAAMTCGGYPFMVQLVGQECFRRREGEQITAISVEKAVPVAQRKLWQLVHEPALADLSARDRDFLLAMAQDDGPSKTSDLAERLGVDAQYAGAYRRRLIEAELIESVGYGLVDFALPYLREYVRTVAK